LIIKKILLSDGAASKSLSNFVIFTAELSKIFSGLLSIPANKVFRHLFAQKKSRNEAVEISKLRTDLFYGISLSNFYFTPV